MTTDLLVRETDERDYSQASDDECRDAALTWINMIRAEYDLDALPTLPRGYRYHAASCVLSIAGHGLADGTAHVSGDRLSWSADDVGLSFGREGRIVHYRTPPLVDQFIQRFDSGFYQDLVIEPPSLGVFAGFES